MEKVSPILWACGVVCIWPMVWAFIAFYFGRRGMPFRIVRNGYSGPARHSKMAIKED